MYLYENAYFLLSVKYILIFFFFPFSHNRGYVGIHSSGFRDFLLKPELLRAIVDSGFEHPSEGNFFTDSSAFYFILLKAISFLDSSSFLFYFNFLNDNYVHSKEGYSI